MTLLRIRHEGAQETTFVELFFDVVFVFAVTELSGRLLSRLSVSGAADTLLLLLVVWWGWIYTTWMTNWFEPTLLRVRGVLLVGMLASLLMAVSIQDAFGKQALLFAGGYVALQVVRNVFIVLSTDEREPMHRSFVRILVWSAWVSVIWLAGALVSPSARPAVWLVALVLDYAGPVAGYPAPRLGRTKTTEWEIEPTHFAERCQQFVIIALGESIVRAAGSVVGLPRIAARDAAFVLAFAITVALWWLYFDEVAERSSRDLAEAEDEQGRLARDAYTYLHIPIIAGVIATAVGNQLVIANPTRPLGTAGLVALAAGPIVYLLGHNAFRLRMTGTLWKSRLVALALIAFVCAAGSALPAVAIWAIVAAILVPVVVIETVARVRGATLIAD